MKILFCWDEPQEADLIALMLSNVDGNEVQQTLQPDDLLSHINGKGDWDVILMLTSHPDDETAFHIFEQLHQSRPDIPIVGASRSEDVYRLARFLTAGMRSYVLRDFGGDFVFLLQATLSGTVKAIEAEKEQMIAEQMRAEIESVRRFQESIIPSELVQPFGYQLTGLYEPAQIRVLGGQPVLLAGGDYYDVLELDKKSIVLIVGDAAGHGMRACMSVLILQTLMSMISARRFHKPAKYMSEMNQKFCEQSVNKNDGSLVTLYIGVLNLRRHEIVWTSAGHPVPILHDQKNNSVRESIQERVGPPLGIDPDVKYPTYYTTLPANHRLLIYTDGLVEAYHPDDKANLFGLDGVSQSMQKNVELSPEESLRKLFDDSHEFTRGIGRHDDTSAILLQRNPV